ncbi:MAG TPA: amidohydrolase family protein [Steroidobacteraceae bacterium]|nr:amidohydrolase family protein [Steroidobacteraceae bacterium]
MNRLKATLCTSLLLLASAAVPAAAPEAQATLIRNVRIFDGHDVAAGSGEVLIVGNKIEAVSRGPLSPPAGTHPTVIDGGGRLLTPGFIDAHVHLGLVLTHSALEDSDPTYVAALELRGAEAALLRGFTTERDTGGSVMGLKRAIDEGYAAGPRIYPSGAAISQTSGHGDDRRYTDRQRHWGGTLSFAERRGDEVIADGVPEVLAAAREQLRLGAVQIKVMASGGAASEFDPLYVTEYTPEELRAAVDAAAGFGTYVTVHSYNAQSTRRAIEAGVKCIEHGHLIDEPTMRLLAERGVFLSTNVVVYEELPPGITAAQKVKFEQVREATDAMMKLARKYHVKLGFGTDLINSLDAQARQNREFTLRSRWFSPLEILRQATSGNAEILALSGLRNPYPGKLGVVEPGAYADLLLINGDPLTDISILEHPDSALALIMKDGRIYRDARGAPSR